MKNFVILLILIVAVIGISGGFSVPSGKIAIVSSKSDGSIKLFKSGVHWVFPPIYDIEYVNIDNFLIKSIDNVTTKDDARFKVNILINYSINNFQLYQNYLSANRYESLTYFMSYNLESMIKTHILQQTLSEFNHNRHFNFPAYSFDVNKIGLKINSISLVAVDDIYLKLSESIDKGVAVESQNVYSTDDQAIAIIESAYYEAMRIKTNTAIKEAKIYRNIELKDSKFYNYLRQLDIYYRSSKSKADVPPLDKLYAR